MGIHRQEKTKLTSTPANRKKLEKVIEKMEAEIILGLFHYAKYFPKSDKAAEMVALNDRK
jgi:integrase